MHRILMVCGIYFLTLAGSSLAFAQVNNIKAPGSNTFLKTAKEFLSAKEKSYQEKATKEDVEAFLNFCTDSIQYDHVLSPGKTFSFTGKDQWREGAPSHLGETRNAGIEITKSMERQNIVIIEFVLYREIKTAEGWKKDSKGTIVSIMEFTKDKKIKKITDYL